MEQEEDQAAATATRAQTSRHRPCRAAMVTRRTAASTGTAIAAITRAVLRVTGRTATATGDQAVVATGTAGTEAVAVTGTRRAHPVAVVMATGAAEARA